jgi:membrane protease YdiL (CAAX protease family)
MARTLMNSLFAAVSGWGEFIWISGVSVYIGAVFAITVSGNLKPLATDLEFSRSSAISSAFMASLLLMFCLPTYKRWARLENRLMEPHLLICVAIGAALIMSKLGLGFLNPIPEGTGFLLIEIIASVLVAAVAEEFFFRGFAWYRMLERGFSSINALIATSLLYTLAHMDFDLFVCVQLFFMGLAFGMVRMLSGSVWLAVLLHALTNSTVWIIRIVQSQGIL